MTVNKMPCDQGSDNYPLDYTVYDIADQDVVIGFSQGVYSVTEDSDEVQVSVHVISGEIKRLSTVSISTVSGTALGMSVLMISARVP